MFRHTLVRGCFFSPPDGAGSGGDPGAGTGGGAGAGQVVAPQGGQVQGGQATPSHLTITDDSMVQYPGMDKPVKYSDHAKGFLPRDQVGSLVREIISAAGQRPQQQQQRPQQQQQQQRDPFADIEAMPLVDGKTAANLARQILTQGFGPRDKVIKMLQEKIQGIEGHVGASRTGSLQNDYAVSRDQVIAGLPLPKLDRPIDGAQSALTEFVDGVFWKYDFEKRFQDPQSRQYVVKEFGETVKKEFETQRAFFRNLEKADLEAAETKSRKARFLRPTGSTGPNGRPVPVFESNRQKASRFFGGSERPS